MFWFDLWEFKLKKIRPQENREGFGHLVELAVWNLGEVQ